MLDGLRLFGSNSLSRLVLSIMPSLFLRGYCVTSRRSCCFALRGYVGDYLQRPETMDGVNSLEQLVSNIANLPLADDDHEYRSIVGFRILEIGNK